ncbi:MAG: peptide-N-glycosidase F-related protein [Myxococcota bacterium]
MMTRQNMTRCCAIVVALSLSLVGACSGTDTAAGIDGSDPSGLNQGDEPRAPVGGDSPTQPSEDVTEAPPTADAAGSTEDVAAPEDITPPEDSATPGELEDTTEPSDDVTTEDVLTPEPEDTIEPVVCPEGYAADAAGECQDIDECTDDAPCDPLTLCTNTPGGFECSACPAGYSGDGASGCQDIDECTGPPPCDPLTACSNTPGGFECSACPAGYSGDGASGCQDIDECTDNAPCDPLTVCTNTPGAYECGACPEGYDGDGATGCELTPAPDQDGDGVPDDADVCPEVSDPEQIDTDGDGTGDACAGCGAMDTPAAVVTAKGITISDVSIDGGPASGAVIATGATFNVNFAYSVTGVSCSGCPGCLTQYFVSVIGEGGGTTLGDASCLYSGGSGCSGAVAGTASETLVAPTTPGTYTVRFGYTWHYSCGQGMPGYMNQSPGEESILATFCVLPEAEIPEPEPECGNGIVEAGESCDDGEDSLTCTSNCETKGCEPTTDGEVITLTTFEDKVINWATAQEGTFPLLDADAEVAKVTLDITMACPPGGCDPWDRLGYLNVLHPTGELAADGSPIVESFELARFITPYDIGPGFGGPGSCTWTFDVTPYAAMLRGETTLSLFISTWIGGDQGWSVTARLNYTLGQEALKPISVQNLWTHNNLIYGDPNHPTADNLPDREVIVPEGAVAAVVRMTTTGHGQGNTDNAAEFAVKTHTLTVDGVDHPWTLWRDDCASNTCGPQGGNWTPNRAGWCPGDGAWPHDLIVSTPLVPGSTLTVGYGIEDYENCCRPDNPECNPNDGSCCISFAGECGWNYTGHTQPHFVVRGQVIFYGDPCN